MQCPRVMQLHQDVQASDHGHSQGGQAEPKLERGKNANAKIFSYGPPRPLAANLWQVTGSLAVPGMPRNMTVYRLPDGGLLLYSVVAMHDEGMHALEALGTPALMVMPHDRHQMDAPFYKSRYPNLRVLAPEPSAPRSVAVDGRLDELEALGIHAYALPDTTYHEVILELPVPATDRQEAGVALCACEILGNVSGLPAPLRLLMKGFGPPGGDFGVARAVRWREVLDRGSMRGWLGGLADRNDIRMVLMGHGAPITDGVSAALRHAADNA
jgi:hypothetical protein